MASSSSRSRAHLVSAFLRRNRGPVMLALINLAIAVTLASTVSTRAGAIVACSAVLAGLVWWFSDSDEFQGATRRVALIMVISMMVVSISLILTIMGLAMNSFHYVVSILPQVVFGVTGVAVLWSLTGRPKQPAVRDESALEDRPDDSED